MSKKIYDFGAIKSGKEIKKTWEEFRKALENGDLSINDIDSAKQYVFLKQYDDLFNQHMGIEDKTITIQDLKMKNMGRGTILKKDEIIDYERFIPKSKFIRHDNRFSPPGVEWLYLAIGNNDNDIHQCAQSECRAKNGERFGFCHFCFDTKKYDLKLVDLTIADDKTYTMIDRALENETKKIMKKANKKIKKYKFIQNNIVINRQPLDKEIKKWSLFTYTKLLSENIFVPLNTNDDKMKTNAYAPFQVMAQYYISLGFSGIIYKSTVSSVGKNIVLLL